MRVNIYAEEMTERVQLVVKDTKQGKFVGIRFCLELPVTIPTIPTKEDIQISGPFIHGEHDDDSSAVTFWGKRKMIVMLQKALALLDDHYEHGGEL